MLGRLSTRRVHKRSLTEKLVSPRRASRNMSFSPDSSSFTVKDTCCGASTSNASTTSPSCKPTSVNCKAIQRRKGRGRNRANARLVRPRLCSARPRGGRERCARRLSVAKRFHPFPSDISLVYTENLVGLGLSQSVSYTKPTHTHEKLFALGKKSGPECHF